MFGSARSLLGHEDEIADILARLRAGVRIEQLDAVRRHKDGHDIDVSLTISTIQDRSGAAVALDARTLTHPEDRETSVEQVERLLAGEIDRIDMEERYPPI
jgi:hypothetical protein